MTDTAHTFLLTYDDEVSIDTKCAWFSTEEELLEFSKNVDVIDAIEIHSCSEIKT